MINDTIHQQLSVLQGIFSTIFCILPIYIIVSKHVEVKVKKLERVTFC